MSLSYHYRSCFFIVAASLLPASGFAISTDFNSSLLLEDGWQQPSGSGGVAADAGPDGAGDHAAFVELNGGNNKIHFMTGMVGSHSTTSPYTGDFSTIENLTFSFDFRHGGAGSDISALRVHLWDADNFLRAATSQSFTITTFDSSWQRLSFSLNDEDLVPFGGGTIAGILSNVSGISIRNTPNPAAGSGSAPNLLGGTSYYIDNIELATVPEPATWALIMGSASLGIILRRNHRNGEPH